MELIHDCVQRQDLILVMPYLLILKVEGPSVKFRMILGVQILSAINMLRSEKENRDLMSKLNLSAEA
jgi:hypothetical protein